MPGRPLRVAMVDDNQLAIDSFARYFSRAPGFEWAGGAADHAGALRLAAGGQQGPTDIILLDVDIPGVDTFILLRHLASTAPTLRIIMFSGYARQELIERALHEGAAGYIVKDERIAVIADLITRAAAGELVLSPEAQAAFMDTRNSQRPPEGGPSAG